MLLKLAVNALVAFIFVTASVCVSAPQAKAQEALALEQQIETAMRNIKHDYGDAVLSDNVAEIAGETIGSIWNRYLTKAGIPDTLAGREELAKRLDLDPAASLILGIGAAGQQKIEYLLKQISRATAKTR